jgi:hypothetical protein
MGFPVAVMQKLFSFVTGSGSGELAKVDTGTGMSKANAKASGEVVEGTSARFGAGSGERLVGSGDADTVSFTEDEYRAAEQRLAVRARIEQQFAAEAARIVELKAAIKSQLELLPPTEARLFQRQLDFPNWVTPDTKSANGLERFLERVTREVRNHQAEQFVRQNPGMRYVKSELVESVVPEVATLQSGPATTNLGLAGNNGAQTLPNPNAGVQTPLLQQPPGGNAGAGFKNVPVVTTRPTTPFVPPGFLGRLGAFAIGPLVMALDVAVFEKELHDSATRGQVLESLRAMSPLELEAFLVMLPAKTREEVQVELSGLMS